MISLPKPKLKLDKLNDYFKNSVETAPTIAVGICLSKNSATVICLDLDGKQSTVLGCFTISTDQQGEQGTQQLASLIAQGCVQRNWQLSDAAVAIDCTSYMQHSVHSEFADPKQIAATVRFDTEESISMDITDLTIAFKILAGTQEGSSLAVFTARKKYLTDIIAALQSSAIDPAVCEPDVASLTRFLLNFTSIPDDANTIYCLLAQKTVYLLDFAKLKQPLAYRTFVVGPEQERTEILKREIPVTSGILGSQGKIDSIAVYDSASQVDCAVLTKSTGIAAFPLDIAAAASIPADCTDSIAFAVAYGVALSLVQKESTVNFRNDFMPYQGKKAMMEKTVKILSISLTVLILAVGLFFQVQVIRKASLRSQFRQKLEKEYFAVMPGRKLEKGSDPVKKLTGELRRIKDSKSGQFGGANQQTVGAKLTVVLEAFNRCASQVNLNIDSISISASAINITGDTSSRDNTLKLFDALRENKLDILQQRLDQKAGRDIFSVSVMPKS